MPLAVKEGQEQTTIAPLCRATGIGVASNGGLSSTACRNSAVAVAVSTGLTKVGKLQ